MSEESERQAALWRSERHREYHLRQYREPYRSTLHLVECVRKAVVDLDRPFRALDVGCGAGANTFHLSAALPRTRWIGVDLAPELLTTARDLIHERRPGTAAFVAADFLQLSRLLPPRAFDLVFSIQTLSWLPDYEPALRELLSMVKPGGWLFVTSLFTDFLVDATIQIRQLQASDFAAEGPFHYNIYSLDRFRAYCHELGATEVRAADFVMDQDIQAPAHRHMGTHTRMLATGERLQVSGPLVLPWKVVSIKLGPA